MPRDPHGRSTPRARARGPGPTRRRTARASWRVVVAALVALAAACASPGPSGPDHATPLAWRVAAAGGGQAVLLGSIHLARRDATRLPPELDAAFDRADVLVFEVDPAQMNPLRMALSLREIAGLPPGERLRDRIPEETWRRLEARAAETGLPLRALDSLEPWAVALQLTGASLIEQGFEPAHGLEGRLAPRIGTRPVIGLETPEEQLEIFDDLPFELQQRMLEEALEPREDDRDDVEALAHAWRRGDADALEAILFEHRDEPEMRPFYEATYARRNRRMAARLGEILAEELRAFVVVGVGHLVGKDAVPRLLSEGGLDVRRISPDP